MVSVILRKILHLFCLLGLSAALLGGCLRFLLLLGGCCLEVVSAGLAASVVCVGAAMAAWGVVAARMIGAWRG